MMQGEKFDLHPERNPLILPVLVLSVFLIGVAVAYALPILDKNVTGFSASSAPYSEKTLDGKGVYDSEGCWYCHTQQVRAVSSDLGLGIVTAADRVVRDRPNELGIQRIGPDLACYGDRETDVEKVVAHLQDPRATSRLSNMPSYSYLSETQLENLSLYLVGLACEGADR